MSKQTREWKMIASATPSDDKLPITRIIFPADAASDGASGSFSFDGGGAEDHGEPAEDIPSLAMRQAVENFKHHLLKLQAQKK